ncbi:unnamed protein product [Nesidiocoris tenuis]|uniref:Uncharacterized protein n=1 Tax=Nesidiocoris tenuis TaxID=355587 RepID=A0A6H5HMX9_9HEMI|nr:unnamed protein product [Nesidiocoris tenuis]
MTYQNRASTLRPGVSPRKESHVCRPMTRRRMSLAGKLTEQDGRSLPSSVDKGGHRPALASSNCLLRETQRRRLHLDLETASSTDDWLHCATG